MEHHPLWHVATGSMAERTTHVHEAVHGWYGDGIRISCWEDFVLSEGVTTYLSARAIEAVWGATAGEAVWDEYAQSSFRWGSKDAWRPGECAMETVNRTDIWSLAPYRRGAFFLLDHIEQETGFAPHELANEWLLGALPSIE